MMLDADRITHMLEAIAKMRIERAKPSASECRVVEGNMV